MSPARPMIGIGVLIQKEGKVLLGERVGSHGAGAWSFPGGHLEFGETPEDCAHRETREEAGIEIMNIRRGPFTNDFFQAEQKHYVTLFLLAEYASGVVRRMEPQKCRQWGWFAWDALPEPLFLSVQHLRDSGFRP